MQCIFIASVGPHVHTLDRMDTQLTPCSYRPRGARQHASRIVGGVKEDARTRADRRIDALTSGSDFTPFLQHAGVHR